MVTLALLLGCSNATNGQPDPRSRARAAPTTTTPTTTAPRPGLLPTSSPTAAPAVGTPCPGTDAKIIVPCLNVSLSRYWTATLGRTVRFVAVANPTAAQVPKDCRSGLRLHTAFTCPIGNTVFLTAPFLHGLARVAPTRDLALRLASTMSHEAGHVVQLVERYPLILRGKGDADSRTVEQQADCLSGVWATSIGIRDADFLRGAGVVLRYVDNAFERRTHGTVAVRLRAILRGQTGRTAASCGLTVR